jgi:ribosome-associated translation inhibitor RaiA
MQIPLQISFENAEPSEAVRAAIEHEVERLEKYNTTLPGVVLPSSRRVRSTATVPSIVSTSG